MATLCINGDDLAEVSQELGSKLGVAPKPQRSLRTRLTGTFFDGSLEIVSPRPGLHLYALDLVATRDLEVRVAVTQPLAVVSLVLAGQTTQHTPRLGRPEAQVEYSSGSHVVSTFQAERSRFRITGGRPHRIVDLHLDPEQAGELREQAGICRDRQVGMALARTGRERLGLRSPMPQRLEGVARQVLECPLTGAARSLFMESKALEILALELDGLYGQRRPAAVANNDLPRLAEARHILEQEYDQPPSLVELARRVGLNEFKLKRGFRQVCGTTVYGYVRQLRMEKARALLEAGEMNVTQAALATGYSCFGHFSAAFKKHFGFLPRQVRVRS